MLGGLFGALAGGEASRMAGDIWKKGEGVLMAAQEAVPAIASGLLGQGNRTDTDINPAMQQAIKDAYKRAQADGSDRVEYKHYDSTPGGIGARLTTGRIGFDEFSKDDAGNITGFTQKYDTNKTARQALGEFNLLDPTTYYKPAEALLAKAQQSGVTNHDITFDTPSEVQSRPTPTVLADNKAKSYTVASGDNLSSISAKYGLSIDEIAKRNNLSDVNKIFAGQQLRIG